MKLTAIVLSLGVFAACKSSSGTTSGATTQTTPPSAGGGGVSNQVSSPVALTCEQGAKDVPGNEGTSWYMRCPDCGSTTGTVWGTDLYTDDSNMCAAALHAGALPKTGGVVLVTWVPGQPTYVGSGRNGVQSQDYGKWGRSFYVQSVDATGKPTSPAVTPPPAGTYQLSCAMGTDVLGGAPGASFHVVCPAGCTTGRLWGTDVYTGDSTICMAAVHAGVTTADKGGPATVTLGGAKDSFAGSTRNGLTSESYGKYDSSFMIAR